MKTTAFVTAILLPLAACSSDGREPGATRESSPDTPGARALAPESDQGQVDEYWSGLPDFGKPAELVSVDSFRWKEWEMPVRGDRRARLEALGIRPLRKKAEESVHPEEPTGQRVEDFHFVDFSGDGVADVVYDGVPYVLNDDGEIGAFEGYHLVMWQVMGERAVKVLDEYTALQRAWRGRPGEPLRFRTVQHGCCGDTHRMIEYFSPETRGDTVRYRVAHRLLGSNEDREPRSFLPRARPFSVAQDRYRLRREPSVSPETVEGGPNFSAEYRRGARGVALAEARDSTGRVWWYVLMDGRTPPDTAQDRFVSDETGEDLSGDRLGWMSSRFLTETPATP
jgi:hypothetical protein